MNEPTFRVRTRAKSDRWFDPADDHEVIGFEDRPLTEEIRLGIWEERHGTGYAVKEIVIPYQALPMLYQRLNLVLAEAIQRVADQVELLETEADEYKAALHKADLETYMEIFTKEGRRVTMTHRVCGQSYTSRKSSEELRCTSVQGHTVTELTDHSWEWLRREEEDDQPGGSPEIDDLIEDIAAGQYDPYIEALLAALHGRKRALRRVPHPYGRTEE